MGSAARRAGSWPLFLWVSWYPARLQRKAECLPLRGQSALPGPSRLLFACIEEHLGAEKQSPDGAIVCWVDDRAARFQSGLPFLTL